MLKQDRNANLIKNARWRIAMIDRSLPAFSDHTPEGRVQIANLQNERDCYLEALKILEGPHRMKGGRAR